MEPTTGMTAFLLAMQAAGWITSLVGAKDKQKLIDMGRQLEQSQFNFNMEAIRLESEQASLSEMQQLRKNLGTQIATAAAKGNRIVGPALNESVSNFQKDEKTRQLNLVAKEASLRAGHVQALLNTSQTESELGRGLMTGLFNTMQTTSLATGGGKYIQKVFDAAVKKAGFGLDPVDMWGGS